MSDHSHPSQRAEGADATGESPRFERALERLESLVEQLDTGELELEESLERFEEGVRLVRLCSERLRSAEIRIQQLREGADGLETVPLAIQAEGEDTP